jgi:hypothetical protein
MERRLQFERFRKTASDEPKEKTMTIKKILTAAAAVALLSLAGAASASADSSYGRDGYGYHDNRGDNDDRYRDGNRNWRSHDGDRWRYRHAHYYGHPFWYRGHYVVRSYDGFGRAAFIEIGPHGETRGYIRF